MSSRTRLLIIFLALVLLGALLSLPFWLDLDEPEDPTLEVPEETLTLFYPRRDDGELDAVKVTPESMPETRDEVPEVVVELLKQEPEDPELIRVVPEDMNLLASHFEGSIVMLDFDEGILGAAEGTRGEYLLLYSVVNSVLANLNPSFDVVFFLVEGEHRNSIGGYGEDSGHIGTDVPLGPRWDERP